MLVPKAVTVEATTYLPTPPQTTMTPTVCRGPVGVRLHVVRSCRERRSERREDHPEARPRSWRASGDGLWIEPQRRSEAGTPCREAGKPDPSGPGVSQLEC